MQRKLLLDVAKSQLCPDSLIVTHLFYFVMGKLPTHLARYGNEVCKLCQEDCRIQSL